MTSALLAELDRELAWRRDNYPGLVAKLRLAEEEAGRRLRALEAVRHDVAELLAGRTPWPDQVTLWPDKVAELERELEERKRLYPAMIAKGRADQVTADNRIASLRAVFDLFWRNLVAWEPPPGPALDYQRMARELPYAIYCEPGTPKLKELEQSEGYLAFRAELAKIYLLREADQQADLFAA